MKRRGTPSSAARAKADADEEDGGDEDVNEGAAVYELMWWAYGKGPVEPDRPARRGRSARMIQDEEMLSQQDDDSSDAMSSDEDLSSDGEPGMQAANTVALDCVTLS